MFMITDPQNAVKKMNDLASMANQIRCDKERIEESCARILKMKYKAGLFN